MKRIGIEIDGDQVRCAIANSQDPKLMSELPWGKHAYVSGLDDVLIRTIHVPSQDPGAVAKALPYQLESVIPGSLEDKILEKIEHKSGKGTDITLYVATYRAIEMHIQEMLSHKIDPQQVTSTQHALATFAKKYLEKDGKFLFFHLKNRGATLVTTWGDRVSHSAELSVGFHDLLEAVCKDRPSLPRGKAEELLRAKPLHEILPEEFPHLAKVVATMRMEGSRLLHFFLEQRNGDVARFFVPSGKAATLKNFSALFEDMLPQVEFCNTEQLEYAAAIGLSVGVSSIQFRSGPFVHPLHKKRFKIRATLLGALSFLLLVTTLAGGRFILHKKAEELDRGVRAITYSVPALKEISSFEALEKKLSFKKIGRSKNEATVAELLHFLGTHEAFSGDVIKRIEFSLDGQAIEVSSGDSSAMHEVLGSEYTIKEIDGGVRFEK